MKPRLPFLLALSCAAPLIVSAAAPVSPAATRAGPNRWARVTIHERVVIRVPKLRAHEAAPVASATPIRWREKKGPKCIAANQLAGALVTGSDVDFVLQGGARVRAKLDDDCPTLAFYSGLYIKPAPDRMICADRDAIRSRSGARCEIDKFRRLEISR